jgi:hypothetical protein
MSALATLNDQLREGTLRKPNESSWPIGDDRTVQVNFWLTERLAVGAMPCMGLLTAQITAFQS